MRGIGLIIFLLILTGCRHREHNPPDSDSISAITAGSTGSNYNDITDVLLEKTDSVLSSLTLEQKVGQCFMPSIFADASENNIGKLKVYISDLCVGGVVLLKGTLNSAAVMASIGREARVPLFIAIDAEWGLGMRLTDAPDFPKNGSLSPEAGEELLFDYGEEVASSFRYAVLLTLPRDVRLRRVRERSLRKFGDRMLPGGDLYEQEEAFFDFAASRPEDMVEEWARSLRCPVIRADGTRPVEENIRLILTHIQN